MGLTLDHKKVILRFLEGLDTPRSLAVAMLAKSGEWGQLVNLKANPNDYPEILFGYKARENYFRDACASDLLRKCGSIEIPSVDTAAAAKTGFWDTETQCRRTNERLQLYLDGGMETKEDGEIHLFIERVQSLIADILGPVPHVTELSCRFGKKSTFNNRMPYCTVADKLTTRPTVYPESLSLALQGWTETAYFRGLLEDRPMDCIPLTVRGNRWASVPKTALTDRSIAVEAGLNVWYQLGIGSVIRSRLLRKAGIDLAHGQDLHRRLAQEYSLTGEGATIDLSNASDTISTNLVRLLTKKASGWFELLTGFRAPFTLVKGNWVRLEKFSSMGNGFTFELETLIFYALTHCACQSTGAFTGNVKRIYCFGDDILLPSSGYRAVVSVLRFFGFTPNQRKSFSEGPFRESCGGDFFRGASVRPHYIEELPNEPQQWISLANGIRRVGKQLEEIAGRSPVHRAWLACLDCIPSDIRQCRGPEQLGDVVIHDDPDRWNCRTGSKQFGPWVRVFRAYCAIPTTYPLERWGGTGWRLAYALMGGDPEGVSLHDDISGYRLKWIPFS